jgi:alanine racemase
MRAEAIVDLSAIKHNVAVLKEKSGTQLLAVVKADAYGHGLVPVAKAALDAGASMLGVALLEEAIALREAGITAPVLAWLVQPGSDFKSAIDRDIDLAAGSIKALHEIQAASTDKKARVHLELDTGMTRGGFLGEMSQKRSRIKSSSKDLMRWCKLFMDLDSPTFSDIYQTRPQRFQTQMRHMTWCAPELQCMD